VVLDTLASSNNRRRTASFRERGQTTIEYLMLLALVFMTAYLTMVGPFGDIAGWMLGDISNSIGNVIQNAEWSTERIEVGTPRHPSNPNRLRPLHLL